ncbi:uncharacterized protein LTR77_005694 [Saxophila tyrrhenica]|uniref:Uncharacterized protein n=1 Tax=Saxophila tyrrhenica TaxID=1690608 RepID=A0AAV9PBF8_9PEZI|nr:hypothetical protein LTR77_005694 [Saxophila tyrrhenica]
MHHDCQYLPSPETDPDPPPIATPNYNIPSDATTTTTETYTSTAHGLIQRHRVHLAQLVAHHFSQGNFLDCQTLCYEVLGAQPSEAIAARCHTLLARKELLPDSVEGRAWHAKKAVQAWRTVVERTGLSRFPVKEARVGYGVAQELKVEADMEMAEMKAAKVKGVGEGEDEEL